MRRNIRGVCEIKGAERTVQQFAQLAYGLCVSPGKNGLQTSLGRFRCDQPAGVTVSAVDEPLGNSLLPRSVAEFYLAIS